jgi:hypothetical protein
LEDRGWRVEDGGAGGRVSDLDPPPSILLQLWKTLHYG